MAHHHFRQRIGKPCIVILLCIAFAVPSLSQEFIFNHLTTKDGLSSNAVHAVWRDHEGFLWVGTETGLQRYDGYTFIYPRYHENNQLQQQAVHQILEDRKGNVWVRMGETIGIFDIYSFHFRTVPIHYKNAVSKAADYHLSKDAEGNIFLIATRVNWFYFNEKSFAFEQDITPFAIPDSFNVLFVYDDSVHHLMWAGGNNGLMVFDKNNHEIYTPAYNPKGLFLLRDESLRHPVTSFYIDSRRRYWIVDWDMTPNRVTQHLRCFDEATNQYTKDTTGLISLFNKYYELSNLKEFGDKNLVVYGAGCLVLNQGHGFESFFDNTKSSYNIEYSRVDDVFEDNEHLLWVATDNGLYNTLSVTNENAHLILDDEKAHAEITSVLQYINKDKEAEIWMGTWGQRGILTVGQSIYKNSKTKLYNRPVAHTPYASVWDMVQHSKTGQVWASCQSGGIFIYDPRRSKDHYLSPAIFKGVTIRQVEEDLQGNLWFGCQNGDIIRWNYGEDISNDAYQYVLSTGNFVTHLYIDQKGLLWISSGNKGILVINTRDAQPVHQYLAAKGTGSLSDNNIRQVLQLDDSLYAIAGDVINFLNIRTGKVTQATGFDGRPIGKILTLQTDDDGQIWTSTTTGIYRYNRAKDTYKQYTQWDGLITVLNESYTLTSSLKLRNGSLVFGGNQNLVMFDPKQYKSNHPPADVTITGVSIFDQKLPVDSLKKLDKIELSHNENSITIHFASLNFTRINKLTYYYQLKGANHGWIAADPLQLQATYNLLPPGEYTFQVRSQNEEGVFSQHLTELHFYIHPSFWQSIWFYLLLAMASAGLLYYLHHLRVQRLLHVEKVRTRLARDLHDDMGSTLSTINILSNMAMQKAGTDEKTTREFISRISNNSSRMMEAMDDIVWSINPVNDSMQKVMARMKEFAGNALEAQDIEYTFRIDEPVKDLSFDMETRRSIFLIFKEAVNNILKYSEATEVNISMELKKKAFVMTIADNGKGFDPSRPVSTSRGNGVKNMQKRAETMQATFALQTAQGKGTCLQLCIPV